MAQELMQLPAARLEFVNVGPRDQARMLGTLGACGTGSCSSTWLQSFSAVSIRMARDQQLPLNPEKITGPCGRLMCCLQYEHDMYRELLKGMPKKGVKACHEESGVCGRVVKLNPLARTVDLRTDEGGTTSSPPTRCDASTAAAERQRGAWSAVRGVRPRVPGAPQRQGERLSARPRCAYAALAASSLDQSAASQAR
jgi:cell fate regulator YaaT (PSP1 superfamily)